MIFVVVMICVLIEFMKWVSTGGLGAGTILFVFVIGFGIVVCCVYVVVGSWDDKCGLRSSECYCCVKMLSVEECVGLLSFTTAAATLASFRRINMFFLLKL